MWLLAIGCGLIVGKTLIHGIILSRFLRLKMFRANQVRNRCPPIIEKHFLNNKKVLEK